MKTDIYKNDVDTIVSFLKDRKLLFLNKRQVKGMYKYFSESMYSARWLMVNDESLNQFANWLSSPEVMERIVKSQTIHPYFMYANGIVTGCAIGISAMVIKLVADRKKRCQ